MYIFPLILYRMLRPSLQKPLEGDRVLALLPRVDGEASQSSADLSVQYPYHGSATLGESPTCLEIGFPMRALTEDSLSVRSVPYHFFPFLSVPGLCAVVV